ncbi:hypothetical protein J5J10_01520 [Ciceribacter sp. L1K23]|uniref:hypothetical protein n=1 Tax=Ciceribacter sp. L1K23 TaxID=2820276 RepID=UPI001B811C7B|nr:hypothetical protein [Ciceribacter sp. L1K23]MBR0554346.1 hypothetical protein [Ciceribacter sp. L1K23]
MTNPQLSAPDARNAATENAATEAGFPQSAKYLVAQLFCDLEANTISPATSLAQLHKRYTYVDAEQLKAALQLAFRMTTAVNGGVVVVSDGDTGKIIDQFPMPAAPEGYGGRSPLGLGLSAMTSMLDRRPRYYNARDFFLHVHIMPDAKYTKAQGRHVEQLGELLLTYKGWDKDVEDLDVPFPDDMPLLEREVCYSYSPHRGWLGFDGERWRCDW